MLASCDKSSKIPFRDVPDSSSCATNRLKNSDIGADTITPKLFSSPSTAFPQIKCRQIHSSVILFVFLGAFKSLDAEIAAENIGPKQNSLIASQLIHNSDETSQSSSRNGTLLLIGWPTRLFPRNTVSTNSLFIDTVSQKILLLLNTFIDSET
ncbi:hypothetical protein AYI68_g1413 [Smittium mucronatum]|uniref:Uncharacterized protein n=1 Tax=Smittium mucronatum TaxID=133383 RepID=A0A1R0H5F8_9FUNG|nr:hypothetical protein AYI68_g1413 [Smittium mucronatum]